MHNNKCKNAKYKWLLAGYSQKRVCTKFIQDNVHKMPLDTNF